MMRIEAPGLDTERLVHQLQDAVKQKLETGVYSQAGLDEQVLRDMLSLQDHAAVLQFYLEHLRGHAFVDISDFEITEKRPRFKAFWIAVKKTLWNLLRFYTFRLWSQQNQINGLLLAAIDGIHAQQNQKILELEKRLKTLEQRDEPQEASSSSTSEAS